MTHPMHMPSRDTPHALALLHLGNALTVADSETPSGEKDRDSMTGPTPATRTPTGSLQRGSDTSSVEYRRTSPPAPTAATLESGDRAHARGTDLGTSMTCERGAVAGSEMTGSG